MFNKQICFENAQRLLEKAEKRATHSVTDRYIEMARVWAELAKGVE